ncbi:MAG: hypothetical protein Ct9H300mP15_04580 [Gemmatimonadota bacterium]|nr:MAG: hypothetical protein Ct9H300mP15_04580 [Gemmatimonadota bacterium]
MLQDVTFNTVLVENNGLNDVPVEFTSGSCGSGSRELELSLQADANRQVIDPTEFYESSYAFVIRPRVCSFSSPYSEQEQ